MDAETRVWEQIVCEVFQEAGNSPTSTKTRKQPQSGKYRGLSEEAFCVRELSTFTAVISAEECDRTRIASVTAAY